MGCLRNILVVILLGVIQISQSCKFTSNKEDSEDESDEAISSLPKCDKFPSTATTCSEILNYTCTDANSLRFYNNTIKEMEETLRNIAKITLKDKCNCRNHTTELFCRLILPQCSFNTSDQCLISVPTNPDVIFPCGQYCTEITKKCLMELPDDIMANISKILKQQNFDHVCGNLTNPRCWNGTYPMEDCQHQQPLDTTSVMLSAMQTYTSPTNHDGSTSAFTSNETIVIVVCVVGGIIVIAGLIVLCLRCRKTTVKEKLTTTMEEPPDNNQSNDVTNTSPEVMYNVLYKPTANNPENANDDYDCINMKPRENIAREDTAGGVYTQVKKNR